jgi:hypothetical protein
MKRRFKIVIVLAAAVAVVCLIAVVHHYQLRWATEAYIAQLKAQGEPMDLAQVLPPPVPPEQNSADTLRQAAALMETNQDWWITNSVGGMQGVAPGKAMVVWQQSDIRNSSSTNSWQNIGAALDRDKEAFPLLLQVIDKPDFDFQINYDAGVADLNFSNLISRLPGTKRAAQRLTAKAGYDLHNGDTASAVYDMRAVLAISKAMRDDRILISELVRIAIAQIGLTANWEILQSSNVTDAQLSQLQHDWADLDFAGSMKKALLMERAMGLITFTKWRDSSSGLYRYLDTERKAEENAGMITSEETLGEEIKIDPKVLMWRYWWSYPDQKRYLKGYKVILNAMHLAQTNGAFQTALQYQSENFDGLEITNAVADFVSDDSDFHWLLSQDISFLGGLIRRVMAVETAKRTVITAIALKRYQLKHGNYPPDLNALVPEFLAAVPLDPVDGKLLRYRLNSDGTFLLYSIGPNAQDDGGNPALEKGVEGSNFYWLNPHALDWVWPQPATAEEIQNFYAHPQK